MTLTAKLHGTDSGIARIFDQFPCVRIVLLGASWGFGGIVRRRFWMPIAAGGVERALRIVGLVVIVPLEQ